MRGPGIVLAILALAVLVPGVVLAANFTDAPKGPTTTCLDPGVSDGQPGGTDCTAMHADNGTEWAGSHMHGNASVQEIHVVCNEDGCSTHTHYYNMEAGGPAMPHGADGAHSASPDPAEEPGPPPSLGTSALTDSSPALSDTYSLTARPGVKAAPVMDDAASAGTDSDMPDDAAPARDAALNDTDSGAPAMDDAAPEGAGAAGPVANDPVPTVTSAPPEPAATVPAPTVPDVPEPVVPEPAATVPAPTVPDVPEPVVPEPAANVPAPTVPDVPEPVVPEPAATVPAPTVPDVPEPVVPEPAANVPAPTVPDVPEPVVPEPAANVPAPTVPDVPEPVVPEPAATVPAPTVPDVPEPVVPEPAANVPAPEGAGAPTDPPAMLITPLVENARVEGNFTYGPHPRNTFELYLTDGHGRTPVMVYFHQGMPANSSIPRGEWHVTTDELLSRGISVIHADYPFIDETDIKGMVGNASLVIDYIAVNGLDIGVDPERMGVYGSGAGGGIALYIATGSRTGLIDAVGHFNAPSTFDIGSWPAIIGLPLTDLTREVGADVPALYGVDSFDDLARGEALRLRVSLDMLGNMDAGSPPIVVWTDGVAGGDSLESLMMHPGHARALLDRCRELGILCVDNALGGRIFVERLGAGAHDFMIRGGGFGTLG
ncbi:PPE-repeat protein [Cenarchaeum symbiosum A]|uniref:PPE-repeat protein n=1 Tax=Cenarchaeum symbiosum (strain A) TaxID=414004 RepID=A0RUC5_CENSY|nr:PPE-repeat protein [Cenarchaeum symbiosum A]